LSVGGGVGDVGLDLFAEGGVVVEEVDEGADDGADAGAVFECGGSECFVAFVVEGHAEGGGLGFIHDGPLVLVPGSWGRA